MTKDKAYIIRKLRTNETELLKDFLYEAIFIPEGVEPPERDIIENPELRVYTACCFFRYITLSAPAE